VRLEEYNRRQNDKMSQSIECPIEDLPNQEKNQYWIVYWLETGAFYIQKGDKETDQQNIWPRLEEGKLKQP